MPGGLPIIILSGSLLGSVLVGIVTARFANFLSAGGGLSIIDAVGLVVVDGEGDMPQRPHIQPPSFFVPILASLLEVVDVPDAGRSAIPIVDRKRELLS